MQNSVKRYGRYSAEERTGMYSGNGSHPTGLQYAAAGARRGRLAIFDHERTLRTAERHSARGQLAKAVAELRKLVDSGSSDVTMLRRAARLLEELEAHEDAIRTNLAIAEGHMRSAQRLRAVATYRHVWQLIGRHAPALAERYGFVPTRIEELCAELREQRRTLNSYAEAAAALEQNNRDAEAIELLNKMVALEPSNPLFRVKLAEAFCRLQRTDEAIVHFRVAAELLDDFDCPADAIRVVERIHHLRPSAADALFAARLYLARGHANDAMHAISKLSLCVEEDAENLDVLSLLARAFAAAHKPEHALRVHREMARIAREHGDDDLVSELENEIREEPGNDDERASETTVEKAEPGEALSYSFKEQFASISEHDLHPVDSVMARTRELSERSVDGDIDFDDIPVLGDDSVEPILSKAALRALNDAATFRKLGLVDKALLVLQSAVEDEPTCSELREDYRRTLFAAKRSAEYAAESLSLAKLYAERNFANRAMALLEELLAEIPGDREARELLVTMRRSTEPPAPTEEPSEVEGSVAANY